MKKCAAGLSHDVSPSEPARIVIEQQDREIAEKSGQIPLRIKSISRAGAKLPEKEWKRR